MKAFPRAGTGFTMVELIVVISIVLILFAISIPILGNMQRQAAMTKSTSNLHQIGIGFSQYVSDNNNLLPAALNSEENLSSEWLSEDANWMVDLTLYLYPEIDDPDRDAIPDIFRDPVYERVIGQALPGWAGGYSMNTQLNLAAGESSGSPANSGEYRYPLMRLPGNAIILGPAAVEGFTPSSTGEVAPASLRRADVGSGSNPSVDHRTRNGMKRDGTGGKDALYLMADFSSRRLTPEEAVEFLKLRD